VLLGTVIVSPTEKVDVEVEVVAAVVDKVAVTVVVSYKREPHEAAMSVERPHEQVPRTALGQSGAQQHGRGSL